MFSSVLNEEEGLQPLQTVRVSAVLTIRESSLHDVVPRLDAGPDLLFRFRVVMLPHKSRQECLEVDFPFGGLWETPLGHDLSTLHGSRLKIKRLLEDTHDDMTSGSCFNLSYVPQESKRMGVPDESRDKAGCHEKTRVVWFNMQGKEVRETEERERRGERERARGGLTVAGDNRMCCFA